MVSFYRDIDNNLMPLTEHKFVNPVERESRIQFGQHSADNQLDGVGRIFWSKMHLEIIHEGQFKDNVLDGFGRCISFNKNGEFSMYIGYWKDGKQHGYGQATYTSGRVEEGVFENGKLSAKEPSLIIDDDFGMTHENKKLDFDKYLIKDGKIHWVDLDYHNDISFPDTNEKTMISPDTTDYSHNVPYSVKEECDEDTNEESKVPDVKSNEEP